MQRKQFINDRLREFLAFVPKNEIDTVIRPRASHVVGKLLRHAVFNVLRVSILALNADVNKTPVQQWCYRTKVECSRSDSEQFIAVCIAYVTVGLSNGLEEHADKIGRSAVCRTGEQV